MLFFLMMRFVISPLGCGCETYGLAGDIDLVRENEKSLPG